MPLSSPKRKVSDTENKLRVLCCLESLGMATQEQLWPFVAQLELMDYVPFCMFVDELRTGGFITVAQHALEGMLYLTGEGRQLLKLFAGRLVPTDRERIREAAPAYAAQLSARRLVHSAYERAPEGEYRAACTVRENDVPTLFLRVTTRDGALAEKTVRDFSRCVPHLLALLYTLPFMACEEDRPAPCSEEQALAAVACGRAALCAYGGREHAAAVQVASGSTSCTLLLLLPDAALAWGWALSADQLGSELAQKVIALLAAGDDL